MNTLSILLIVILTLLVVGVLFLLFSNAVMRNELHALNANHEYHRKMHYEWQDRVRALEEKARTRT